MPMYLSTPPAIMGNEKEQLNQLRSYVFQTVEALNIGMKDMSAEGVLEEINGAVTAEGNEDEEDKSILATHNNIRSLIIKTADYAIKNSEEFRKILKSEYSASSDFGELAEKLENEITANAEGINQLFRYTSGIRSEFGDFSTTSEQYIKTGLLYYDDAGAPVFGVGVGNLSTKIDANGKTVLDKQNLLTTTTAEEIAFWNGGQKIAYINANKMYFPSGSLTAYEADISGKITATSGEIGHCKITDCELMGSLSVYPKSGDTARKGIMGFDTYQDHFGDMREALLIKHEVGNTFISVDNLYTTIGFDNGSILSHVECARTGLTMQSFELPSSGSYDDAGNAASIVMTAKDITIAHKFIHTSSAGKERPMSNTLLFGNETVSFICNDDGDESGFVFDGSRLEPINNTANYYLGNSDNRFKRLYCDDIRIYVSDSEYYNADDILTACGLI